MGIKRKHIEPLSYEKSYSEKIACSKCGRVLISPHEGIVGDNNVAFCEYCYKSLLFPNLNENYLEIVN